MTASRELKGVLEAEIAGPGLFMLWLELCRPRYEGLPSELIVELQRTLVGNTYHGERIVRARFRQENPWVVRVLFSVALGA